MNKSIVTGITHLGIRVRELAPSQNFYALLGFEFIAGPVGPEPVAILKHPCGVEINLVLNASVTTTDNILMDIPQKHPGYTHVALTVNDLDDALLLLNRNNIKITGGPVDYPGGSRGVFIRDPDRNVVELYQHA